MPQKDQSEDVYEFTNPSTVETNLSETVVSPENCGAYYAFYSSEWEVTTTVIAKRKPKAINIGSVWSWNNSESLRIQVIGFVSDGNKTYIASKTVTSSSTESEPQATWLESEEDFRASYKEIL